MTNRRFSTIQSREGGPVGDRCQRVVPVEFGMAVGSTATQVSANGHVLAFEAVSMVVPMNLRHVVPQVWSVHR
jgi:hypothetical protein